MKSIHYEAEEMAQWLRRLAVQSQGPEFKSLAST